MELFLFKFQISSEIGLHCFSSNFMTEGCCLLFVIYFHNLCAVLLPKLIFLISRITQLLKLWTCFLYSRWKATGIQLALIGTLWGKLSKREKMKGCVNLTCRDSWSHTAGAFVWPKFCILLRYIKKTSQQSLTLFMKSCQLYSFFFFLPFLCYLNTLGRRNIFFFLRYGEFIVGLNILTLECGQYFSVNQYFYLGLFCQ